MSAPPIESIEMQIRQPTQPPRSEPIDIVRCARSINLPRGGEPFSRDRRSIPLHRSHSKSTSSSDDDTSAIARSSSIRPFNGEDSDRCVEDFVADVDSECRRLGWTGSMALDKAKCLLSGRASSVLVTGSFISWNGLREVLLKHFGHRDTLRHCSRLRGESVADFRRRIADTAEREAIRVMIRGLRADIATMVEEARPTTLMDAACIAAFYETGGSDSEVHLMQGQAWPHIPQETPILMDGLREISQKGIF